MDTDNIKPEKFIYSNPDIGKGFSYEIFRRKEYYDNRLGPSEVISGKRGIPLLSQKLASTFFSKYTQYKNGLFFHEPGTGKSCLSSFIIENFKDTLVNDRPRKPALIIVPNETLEKNYRRDIDKQCTKEGVYRAELTKAEKQRIYETGENIQLTEETKERRLKASISKTYEIVTHETFLSNLPQSEEQIKKEYSNRIIVIDEAHHFRMQTATGQGKKKKATATDKALGREPGVTEELYTKLNQFLHTVENCRILLLTGTPIWDQVYEIASLMNLILDKENQLPIRNNFLSEYFEDEKLIPEKESDLKKRFRGMVSYLRPMMTTAVREEIGISEPWLKRLKVYPSVMSDFQNKNYKKAYKEIKIVSFSRRDKSGNTIQTSREIEGGPMRLLARDAATFVFPILNNEGKLIGGEYGTEAFNKHIEFSKGIYKYKNQKVASYIKDNLQQLSSKFYALIECIKNNPNELVFIYDEYISSGGGVINLCLVLEQHGFEWAKNAGFIRKPSERKRFCAITSKEGTLKSAKKIENFIKSFNEPDNKYGERCQIIIGSRKIAEGVTIKNVRQGHIVMGHWNVPTTDQALGRIFRVGSHDAFENEDEKYIKIYKHVAVEAGNIPNKFDPKSKYSDNVTLDLTIYQIAEEKEILNTQIYRLLKEVSWDCPLVYGRNVLKGDQNFSRGTDYKEKNYKCFGFKDEYIDKTQDVWKYNVPESEIIRDTYDLFYNKEEGIILMGQLKKLFEIESSCHLNYIKKELKLQESQEFLLLKTLDYLITSKTKIKNRYGFLLTLNEYKDVYYLDDNLGVTIEPSSIIYTQTPFVYEYKSLEVLSNINQYTSDKENIERICKKPTVENIKKLNYRTMIILLEVAYKILSKNPSGVHSPLNTVMDVLGSNLYNLPNGDVIHVMYNTEYMGLGYNVSLQEINPNGNMRIFSFEKKDWSYVDNVEDEEKYIKQLKTSKKTNIEEWEEFPQGVYGFTEKDGKFKIKIKPKEGSKRATKGSVCLEASWSIPKLYELMNQLNAFPEIKDDIEDASYERLYKMIDAQTHLRSFLQKKRTLEELKMILTIHTMDKKSICEFIKEWFRKNKMYKENIA